MKKIIKKLFGSLLILLGIGLGVYLGLYVLFIGGVINIIEFVKSDLSTYGLLTKGIIKIIVASPVGYLVCLVFLLIGRVLTKSKMG